MQQQPDAADTRATARARATGAQHERWWVCTCTPLDLTTWVLATTRAKARWKIIRAARRAFYRIQFSDVTVRPDNSGLAPLPGDTLIES